LYIKSLENHGWKYEIVGLGKKWEGFRTRMQWYLEKLLTLNPEQLVNITDCYDVFCVRSPINFLEEAFNSFTPLKI
jgi:hypothetical protein